MCVLCVYSFISLNGTKLTIAWFITEIRRKDDRDRNTDRRRKIIQRSIVSLFCGWMLFSLSLNEKDHTGAVV